MKDLERAIVFYCDALRIPVSGAESRIFRLRRVRLMLGLAEGVEDRGNPVIYFKVEDIERTQTARRSV